MRQLIDKAELMQHIENEMREWGEEYDALQILGDIEDFPTVDVVVGKERRMRLTYEEISTLIAFIKMHEREEIPDDVWDLCMRMYDEVEEE